MPVFHYVVLTQAVPGRLEEFEEWYDKQHLRDVVAVPGVRSAKRYRLINKITDDVEPPPFDSLAIYEIDADDPVEATRVFTRMARTPSMPVRAISSNPASIQLSLRTSPVRASPVRTSPLASLMVRPHRFLIRYRIATPGRC